MNNQDTTPDWGSDTELAPLQHPISEFNAREGLDLATYLEWSDHLEAVHSAELEKNWETVQDQLPKIESVHDPETLQHMRILRFNHTDTPADRVVVMNLPFSVDLDVPQIALRAHAVSEALGEDTELVVFENPSTGKSDNLKKPQRSQIKAGDFSGVAEPMLRVLQMLNYSKVSCIGYSMGAEIAVSIAANASKYGIDIDSLFAMEAPRVEPRIGKELNSEFMKEGKNLEFYWRHPNDTTLKDATEIRRSKTLRQVKMLGGFASLYAKHGLGTLAYQIGMTKGGLASDLEMVKETQPDVKIIIANSGASKISTTHANNEVYKRVRSMPGNDRRIIMPGETHSFADSVKRFAHLVKIALR